MIYWESCRIRPVPHKSLIHFFYIYMYIRMQLTLFHQNHVLTMENIESALLVYITYISVCISIAQNMCFIISYMYNICVKGLLYKLICHQRSNILWVSQCCDWESIIVIALVFSIFFSLSLLVLRFLIHPSISFFGSLELRVYWNFVSDIRQMLFETVRRKSKLLEILILDYEKTIFL